MISVGKKIYEASMDGDILTLTFTDGTKISFQDSGQDCCERRYMTCDDDLSSFSGATFLGAEVAEAPPIDDGGDYHDVQFLRLHTTKGDIVCETHNEHNGYYGGFAVVITETGDRVPYAQPE